MMVRVLKQNSIYTSHVCKVLFLSYKDDLSYKKVASQSRTYVGTQYDATNAVDGNIMTCMRAGVIGITASDKTVRWKVDLGGLRNVYSINILFKNYYSYGDYEHIC